MSLDETCLSNGDVYTILTNKAAHGGKGALAAMVRGVASDTVSAILRKVPLKQRLRVKTVTTDLSSAMMLTVRNVFPGASLVNDRFHVQQLISEAVDQLRIRHRWEVLDAENKAIRKHRQKRKEAKSKEERNLIGQWEPERMQKGQRLHSVCLFRQPARRPGIRLPASHRPGQSVRPAASRSLFKGQEAHIPAGKAAVFRRIPLYRNRRPSHAV